MDNSEEVYHVVSLSGGKDSTAMLLLMLKKEMKIDVVLNADTGMEFPEMYEHLKKLDDLLYQERGIHITTLKHPKGFEWLMFEEPKVRKSAIVRRLQNNIPLEGNGWPRFGVRWCTGQLKTMLINEKAKELSEKQKIVQYIGIAYDERKRCKEKKYPLVEWGITEADALEICYNQGFYFGGLYEIYKRASCWCCLFQRIGELRNLRKYHPELWERLRKMDERAIEQFGRTPLGKFRKTWTIGQLEERFKKEEQLIVHTEILEERREGNTEDSLQN